MRVTDDRTAVWMYTVTRDAPGGNELPNGVAGERVRTLDAAGLTAVVGTVGLDDFGEAALRRNLEDLDWLEVTARAHDAVVAAVAAVTTTIPLRLATVCSDDERVRTLLTEHRAQFEDALRRVTGRSEWGVRAFAVPDETPSDPEDDGGAGGGPGARYLARRRTALSAREAFAQVVAGEAAEVHAALLRLAVAGRRQASTAPVLTGTRDAMPLNGTYLVDDDRTDEFATAVASLDRSHDRLRLELTGPWPPYSFAALPDRVDRESP